MRSPALGAEVGVRLLLPKNWAREPHKRWPTLYLLHGCCTVGDGQVEWTTYSDVEAYTRDLDALIVMPEAGDVGFYSDWLDGPAWETFHLTELRHLLERQYRSGDDRAIAGLSMGGFGTLSYVARHPGMFKAAAAYSGLVHTTYQSPLTQQGLQGLVAAYGADPNALWGDPTTHARTWAATTRTTWRAGYAASRSSCPRATVDPAVLATRTPPLPADVDACHRSTRQHTRIALRHR